MLLQAEGFDHYGAGNFHTTSTVMYSYFTSNGFTPPNTATVSSTTAGKRAGSLGVRLTAALPATVSPKWIEKDVRPESYKGVLPWTAWENFIFFRFAFRIIVAPTGRLVIFRCGDIEVSVGSDWFVYVKRGDDAEISTGYQVELNIWNFPEFEFNSQENVFRIWMNDYMAYEITSYTVPTLEKYQICAHYQTGGTAHAVIDIDDFSMNDGAGDINNDRLGKTYVQTRYPTSDDVVQMSRSAGAANYLNVNETTPNNDTNYVFSNIPGTTDLYKNTTAVEAIDDAAICAVIVIPAARMVEPDSLSVTAVVKSQGEEAEGSRMQLKAASYTAEKHIFEVDPSSGMRWLPADVSEASFGVRILDRDLG